MMEELQYILSDYRVMEVDVLDVYDESAKLNIRVDHDIVSDIVVVVRKVREKGRYHPIRHYDIEGALSDLNVIRFELGYWDDTGKPFIVPELSEEYVEDVEVMYSDQR